MIEPIFRAGRIEEFFRTLEEESHRGCAIIAMCMMEESLSDLYQSLLPEPTKRQLAHFTKGHLDTSLVRAMSLGLISADEKILYLKLAGIRDDFAHGNYGVRTFDDPIFTDRLEELPVLLRRVAPGNTFDPMPVLNRGKFVLAVSVLHSAFYIRMKGIVRLPKALPAVTES